MRHLGLCFCHMWRCGISFRHIRLSGIRYALEVKDILPEFFAIFFCAADLVGCSCFPHVALYTLKANYLINGICLMNRNCVGYLRRSTETACSGKIMLISSRHENQYKQHKHVRLSRRIQMERRRVNPHECV